MTCPSCDLENPEDAGRCDCGYEFSGTRFVAPVKQEASPKPRVLLLLGLLVILLFVFRDEIGEAFNGSKFTPAPPTKPIIDYKPAERPCLSIDRESISGSKDEYWTTIKGTVKNACGESYSLVSVKFQLSDKSGAVVGNAIDTLTGLGPLQSWRFKALGPIASDFSAGEVQGYKQR